MIRLPAILCAAVLAGCAVTPEVTVQVTQSVPDIVAPSSDEPPIKSDCDPKVKAIVRKYFPKALSYPPRTAHREAYLSMIDAEYRALMVGASPLERGLCDIVLKHAMQDVALKAEEARGIR